MTIFNAVSDPWAGGGTMAKASIETVYCILICNIGRE